MKMRTLRPGVGHCGASPEPSPAQTLPARRSEAPAGCREADQFRNQLCVRITAYFQRQMKRQGGPQHNFLEAR